MTYTLFDQRTGKPLSTHPNADGAKLSSLFHVNNGDKVYWEPAKDVSVEVAHSYGTVGGKRRFRIAIL